MSILLWRNATEMCKLRTWGHQLWRVQIMIRFAKCSAISSILVLAGMVMVACGRKEPASVTIAEGKVARVNGCHIHVDQIRYYEDGAPLGDFRFACNVSESALIEKAWWGNQTPPLMNSLGIGGCMRLEKTFYCVKTIEAGKSVTLEATYRVIDSDGTLIGPIR